MNDDGMTGIEEKFLGVGDLFGLQFRGGLVFLEVQGVEFLQFRPYTEVGSIAAGDNSGFSRLEHSGDDLLHIDEAEHKVLHAGIGQRPQSIRRYTNYPESETRLRTIPNLSVPSSRSGDDYGYVDGNDSPYDEPTDVEELLIPPLVNLDFDFYNPNQNESKSPVLNIKMAEYNINPLDHREHPNAVGRILSPGSPIPVYPAGSIDNQVDMSGRVQSAWGVAPVGRDEVEL